MTSKIDHPKFTRDTREKRPDYGHSKFIVEAVHSLNNATYYRVWERTSHLGSGSSADVYRIRQTGSHSSRLCAAKIFQKSFTSNPVGLKVATNEIRIHKSMIHDNIVNYVGSILDRDQTIIVSELCDKGTLKELIDKRRLGVDEAMHFVHQILLAVLYMHASGVVHRDLKPANMLLTGHHRHLKIGDFGTAVDLDERDPKLIRIVGTPDYQAPEIINQSVHGGKAGDVWSIGCCLYAMMYGRSPFDGGDVKPTHNNIKNHLLTFPVHVPITSNVKNLIRRCLTRDPSNRPTCEELLFDFFSGHGIPEPGLLTNDGPRFNPLTNFPRRAKSTMPDSITASHRNEIIKPNKSRRIHIKATAKRDKVYYYTMSVEKDAV